jgi:hypothetical protein
MLSCARSWPSRAIDIALQSIPVTCILSIFTGDMPKRKCMAPRGDGNLTNPCSGDDTDDNYSLSTVLIAYRNFAKTSNSLTYQQFM